MNELLLRSRDSQFLFWEYQLASNSDAHLTNSVEYTFKGVVLCYYSCTAHEMGIQCAYWSFINANQSIIPYYHPRSVLTYRSHIHHGVHVYMLLSPKYNTVSGHLFFVRKVTCPTEPRPCLFSCYSEMPAGIILWEVEKRELP